MSHFTTLKTELRDHQTLLDSLIDLGFSLDSSIKVVGGYRGAQARVDIAVTQSDSANFGFALNPVSGAYELVADLDLWRHPVPVERFLARLTQRYALRTLLAATAQEGFQVSEQTDRVDGSIELVVTRWDG